MNTEFDPDRFERARAYFGARATGIALLEEVRGASTDDLVKHAGATRAGAEELLGVRAPFLGRPATAAGNAAPWPPPGGLATTWRCCW